MTAPELLREAAALMRRQASNATPGHWKIWGMSVMADQDGTSNYETALPVAVTTHEAGLRTFNAHHIASWDPAVAFAVANLLDNSVGAQEHDVVAIERALLRVARAYLRSDDDRA